MSSESQPEQLDSECPLCPKRIKGIHQHLKKIHHIKDKDKRLDLINSKGNRKPIPKWQLSKDGRSSSKRPPHDAERKGKRESDDSAWEHQLRGVQLEKMWQTLVSLLQAVEEARGSDASRHLSREHQLMQLQEKRKKLTSSFQLKQIDSECPLCPKRIKDIHQHLNKIHHIKDKDKRLNLINSKGNRLLSCLQEKNLAATTQGTPSTSTAPRQDTPSTSTAPRHDTPSTSTAPRHGTPSTSTAPRHDIPRTSTSPKDLHEPSLSKPKPKKPDTPSTSTAPRYGTPSTSTAPRHGTFSTSTAPRYDTPSTSTAPRHRSGVSNSAFSNEQDRTLIKEFDYLPAGNETRIQRKRSGNDMLQESSLSEPKAKKSRSGVSTEDLSKLQQDFIEVFKSHLKAVNETGIGKKEKRD